MMRADSDLEHVRALTETYAKALWCSDVDTLTALFHPRSNLYGVGNGALEEYTVDAWLEIVGSRAPSEGNADFEIKTVEQPADDLAVATLDCAVTGRKFTDTLSFLKIDGNWRVIAKTFHIHE